MNTHEVQSNSIMINMFNAYKDSVIWLGRKVAWLQHKFVEKFEFVSEHLLNKTLTQVKNSLAKKTYTYETSPMQEVVKQEYISDEDKSRKIWNSLSYADQNKFIDLTKMMTSFIYSFAKDLGITDEELILLVNNEAAWKKQQIDVNCSLTLLCMAQSHSVITENQ